MTALCKKKLELAIQDPGGYVRRIPLTANHSVWLGRDPMAPAPIKDATLPPRAGELHVAQDLSVWMKAAEGAPAFALGDLEAREARLLEDVKIRWGESSLRLHSTPSQSEGPSAIQSLDRLPHPHHEKLAPPPSGVKPWQTVSPSGRRLLSDARKAARTPLALYLEGETGTGKEVLAHLLHAWSDRASGPFVPLNCAALNLSLVESELFGHVKGAFTGAHHHRAGALMQAHNGTLFLDEIGDLSADVQVKLLRFLENGEIRHVGSDSLSRASVRILCATHKPLATLVASGHFRRDLYYRLASVTLVIPPLRERPDDIEALAKQFAREFKKQISPQAITRLKSYSWPGNVRELRHAIERACALAGEFTLVLSSDSLEFLIESASIDGIHAGPAPTGLPFLNIREMEKHLLIKALKATEGNRTEAARLLGVARSTLFEMLKRYQIP
ncbi:MAG: sigma-54 interaction domain-containing protein [Oligoflexia bacterium]